MKVVWIAVAILVILCILLGVHSYIMSSMAKQIISECDAIKGLMSDENWTDILLRLKNIEKIWEKHRIWASATIESNDMEQIEISLAQSRAFAQSGQFSGFVGEFTMFAKLIEHIPVHEGFYPEEIL